MMAISKGLVVQYHNGSSSVAINIDKVITETANNSESTYVII